MSAEICRKIRAMLFIAMLGGAEVNQLRQDTDHWKATRLKATMTDLNFWEQAEFTAKTMEPTKDNLLGGL